MNSNAVITALLALATTTGGGETHSTSSDRRAELARISERLSAGDASAIDDLLRCTKASSPDRTPKSADIERLRAEVERLRAARPALAASTADAHATTNASDVASDASRTAPSNPETALREARAWLRAGDPNRCLKALPPGDGEAQSLRASALERIGRDAQALDAYRRVLTGGASSFSKLSAQSGIDHLEWRMRREHTEGTKP
jgi:Flp pilus assembly protein TadD